MKRRGRDEALNDLYDEVPQMQCKGLCQASCHSVGVSPAETARIKETYGVELQTDVYPQGCPMLTLFGRCRIYPDRPLVCRLWGAVPSMACPHGCLPVLREHDGRALTWKLMKIT